jgi:hypothetical protein
LNYHREIDQKEHAKFPATEIITAINVPREELPSFLAEVRDDFRKNNSPGGPQQGSQAGDTTIDRRSADWPCHELLRKSGYFHEESYLFVLVCFTPRIS